MPELRQELAKLVESDISTVSWPDAEAIRARGDRRRRAFALATPAAAVLALAFAGGVVLLKPHQRDPGVLDVVGASLGGGSPSAGLSPTPSARLSMSPRVVTSADVAWIPAEALPPTTDVGRDLVVSAVKEIQPQVDTPDWIFAAEGCPAYQTLNIRPARYLFKLAQQVKRAAPITTGPPTGALEIRRYAVEDAMLVLAGVRQVVTACPTYETDDVGGSTPERPMLHRRSYEVVSAGFAGDESLLLQGTVQEVTPKGEPLAEPVPIVLAVIRVDDLVTIVDLGLNDPARTTDLAKKAATRLCAATPAC